MFNRWKNFPIWVLLSLAVNGLLILIVVWLLRDNWLPAELQVEASNRQRPAPEAAGSGSRLRLSYNRWIEILGQEAKVAAEKPPPHLNILLGDSLSLWFPADLLPGEKSWLNQGISGEVASGLLRRLNLFDGTQPETIFLLIGINDLIRGVTEDDLLWNYRRIVRRLKRVHPQAEIVVQSILPHGGDMLTWEGRDREASTKWNRLLAIPNSHIREINRKLEAIAQEEGVQYLDLHPLFTDEQGNLRAELSTDGLHLNRQGYLVWRSALLLFHQLKQQQGTGDS